MSVIWKYPLRPNINRDTDPYDEILVRKGATVLSVVQNADLSCVAYVLVDSSQPEEYIRVWMIGTGREINLDNAPVDEAITYFVQTLQTQDGHVWHIWQGESPRMRNEDD